MPLPALVDATILSNFAHVRRPDLLRQAFDRVAAPPTVMDEIRVGEATGRLPVVDWSWIEIVVLAADEQIRADTLSRSLGRGESDCLAIAASKAWLVLTDDRDARRAAAKLGIEVSGTLGALANLVAAHVIGLKAADALLLEMIQHGYHSPIQSLRDEI